MCTVHYNSNVYLAYLSFCVHMHFMCILIFTRSRFIKKETHLQPREYNHRCVMVSAVLINTFQKIGSASFLEKVFKDNHRLLKNWYLVQRWQ